MKSNGAILVCDDEAGMLRYLKKMLEASGMAVETYGDGASLLRRIEAGSPGDARLLLQDVMLPDVDGMQVLQRVRELRPALPVVMMSAYASRDVAAAVLDGGAQELLSKPFTREQVLAVIRDHTGTRC